MREELRSPEVTDVAVAVVLEDHQEYGVYLINLKGDTLRNVLVSSKGYGHSVKTEERVTTSELRHFLGDVPPRTAQKVETIIPDVFGLTNQYWVSFQLENKMYDKKYIFLPETIKDDYFKPIPFLEKPGVMIR